MQRYILQLLVQGKGALLQGQAHASMQAQCCAPCLKQMFGPRGPCPPHQAEGRPLHAHLCGTSSGWPWPSGTVKSRTHLPFASNCTTRLLQ